MKKLAALTSLRFFAAAMIVVIHTEWYFGVGSWLIANVQLDAGVTFFFVLSGFVLFYSHQNMAARHSGLAFIGRRIARIWPAHLVTFLSCFLLFRHHWGWVPGHIGILTIVANISLLQAWVPYPRTFYSFNGVSWSLSAEMFFYVIFPLLMADWKNSWWWKIAASFLLAVGCIEVARLSGVGFFNQAQNRPSIDAYVYIFPAARLFEFTIGMMAAYLFTSAKQITENGPAWLFSILELAILAITAGVLIGSCRLLPDLSGGYFFSDAALKWISVSGPAPVFGALIYVMAFGKGRVARFLAYRPFILLGEISFSLYLVHQILARVVVDHNTVTRFGHPHLQYLAFWAVALGLSYLLWVLVEKPAQRGLSGWFDRRLGSALHEERSQATMVV